MSRSRTLAGIIVIVALAAGCARRGGPPAIALGAPCAKCGMEIQDRRFACERDAGGKWRAYDAIECLLADAGTPSATQAWLADYDEQALHRADSIWVVRGDFASPMGGGFAAFTSRAAADSVSTATHGEVGRLDELGGKPR